ncbi:MAG: hypothetical protein MUF20_00380, partial [Methylotetracoccus sp.]|nr:hypothetical protein [Methylotetracoccus sp.]
AKRRSGRRQPRLLTLGFRRRATQRLEDAETFTSPLSAKGFRQKGFCYNRKLEEARGLRGHHRVLEC